MLGRRSLTNGIGIDSDRRYQGRILFNVGRCLDSMELLDVIISYANFPIKEIVGTPRLQRVS